MIYYIVVGLVGFCFGNIFQIIIRDWNGTEEYHRNIRERLEKLEAKE